MAKKNLKAALGASLNKDKQTVKNRFEKADAVLAGKQAALSPPASDDGKVIRDSFTMPANDYDLIATLKQRCLQMAISVNKSELLRAGLNALNRMTDKQLRDIIESLEKVKPGRPAPRE
jgi:hypothetical protein